MRYPMNVLAILIFVGAARAGDSDKPWQIHGQVVDEQGIPVEDFEAATFWSSNGKYWNEAGERFQVTCDADAGKIWKEEGVLAAHSDYVATRLPEGRFSLTTDGRPTVSVFAVDKRHERGGIVLVDQRAADKPFTITIAPLVRVTADVYCSEAGRTPDWSMVQVYSAGSKNNKLTQCGSLRGKITLLLPPGEYYIDVYSEGPDAAIGTPKRLMKDAVADLLMPGVRVEIPRGKTTLDLGVFDVRLRRD